MKPHRALLALLAATGVSLAVAVPAFAHPLGNFTINRFSQIQLNGDRIDVLYVVDYAEIPTFQEKQRIADDPAYVDRQVRDLTAGLVLEVSGQRVPLTAIVRQIGLATTRAEVLLVRDGKEIVLKPGDLFHVKPGHDSWVVGDEPYVSIHFLGAGQYAK